MRLLVRVVLAGLLPVAASTSIASAQTGSAPTGSAPTSAAVARADLAAAYLRLDKAYAAAILDDTARAAVNRLFDRSTISFLTGRFAASIAAVDSATRQLGGRVDTAPQLPPRLVNGRAPSVLRASLLARLAKLDTTGALSQAFVTARARTQLLVDVPSPERSAEFLSDPAALGRDLVREVAVLERGRNPYVGQAGDAWHVFRGAKGALIPMRVVAPSAAATSSAPVPVIIALHGAGGDENMFIEGYGVGVVAKMALASNAILVTPLTNEFAQSPDHFDSLMVVLRSQYRVNDARVYLLGHSMGAAAAARLAQLRPQHITAVACLAGGTAVTVAKAPPILFIGAALDPIIPASRVKDAATGTPTGTYRQLENEGHTLMVGNGVKQAIPWLLAHRP